MSEPSNDATGHSRRAPLGRTAGPRPRLRASILVVGALLMAAFIGSAAYDGWRLHQQVTAANDRELSNLANALAQEAASNLQAVDLLLRDTATWYEAAPDKSAAAVGAMLQMRASGVRQVNELTIVDAQGHQLLRSRDTGEPLADVSGHAYFRSQIERSVPSLFVNETVVTRAGPKPGMVLSRRLSGPGGRFDGVVTATVTVDQLQAAYASIELGEGSALLLTSGDGTLVVRQPRIVGIEGKFRFPALATLRRGAVIDRAVSPMDGRMKLVSAIGVGDQPLILAVTRDEAVALRPWVDEMRSATIRTVLISVLIVLTIAALLRQLRRAEQAELERARLEARLQQAQRLEAIGTLAGGIAHDFNNILGAILGFGEMAQQRAEAGSALRRYVDQMMQSGLRARLLVKKILDFSRNGVSERVPVHVQAVVEEVVAMLSPTLPPGVRLASSLTAGDVAVMGDATELHQVAMNLCTNAVQAIGEGADARHGGVVEVTLAREEIAQARAAMHGDLAPGRHVRLCVSDSGPGMDAQAMARIFDPFFTTKRAGAGTGLGLSVVHGIVTDLGGAIDVHSTPGRGTQVSVWLPVDGDVMRPHAAASVETGVDWPRGAGETVMIVDDERALVELAEELLAGLGYEPVGFDSSEAALRAFAAGPERFDVVLTDFTLPGLSGTELASRLHAARPTLPVVLMSGNLDATAEQDALSQGIAATLHKPLALDELAQCLARTLALGTDAARQ